MLLKTAPPVLKAFNGRLDRAVKAIKLKAKWAAEEEREEKGLFATHLEQGFKEVLRGLPENGMG